MTMRCWQADLHAQLDAAISDEPNIARTLSAHPSDTLPVPPMSAGQPGINLDFDLQAVLQASAYPADFDALFNPSKPFDAAGGSSNDLSQCE